MIEVFLLLELFLLFSGTRLGPFLRHPAAIKNHNQEPIEEYTLGGDEP